MSILLHSTVSSLSFGQKLWGRTQNKRKSVTVTVMPRAMTCKPLKVRASSNAHPTSSLWHCHLDVTLTRLLVFCSSPAWIFEQKRLLAVYYNYINFNSFPTVFTRKTPLTCSERLFLISKFEPQSIDIIGTLMVL